MRLYQTPGGTWAGSEKEYKAAMKAEGSDPKTQPRRQVDVPTDKPGLMEFLTFHNVNVINPRAAQPMLSLDEMFAGDGLSPAPEVAGGDLPPSTPQSPPVAPTVSSANIHDQVEALPITAQLDVLVAIADRAHKAIYHAK